LKEFDDLPIYLFSNLRWGMCAYLYNSQQHHISFESLKHISIECGNRKNNR